MKATGIVRKIDDLGRIVIPKEIKKNLHIKEGDPLEIFIQSKGEIILKKYAPMGDMIDIAGKYVEALTEVTDLVACITDSETVIAVSGISKNEYLGRSISEEVIEIMKERKNFNTLEKSSIPILLDEKSAKYVSQIVIPIISNADALGTVILFSLDKNKITNIEVKLAESTAKFLSKQLD